MIDYPQIQPSDDTTYIEKISKVVEYMEKLTKLHPDTMKGITALHEAAFKPGALDAKVKELICLGIGVAVHCDECIAFHTNASLEAGATEEEIVETLGVAIMMGAGPSLAYATHAIETLEQLKAPQK